MSRIDQRVRRFLRARRNKKCAAIVIGVLSLFVAGCVVWSLRLPGITLGNGTICGKQEHTHSLNCQGASLACPEVLHTHQTGCYNEAYTLTCGLADFVVHTHDSQCYDSGGALACLLPEVLVHSHSETCYETEQILTDPGHTHSDGCYQWEQSENLRCVLEETQGHTHTGDCYEMVKGQLLCTLEEKEAVYTAGEPVLTCQLPEVALHSHTDGCYTFVSTQEKVLSCTQTVVTAHQHTQECYQPGNACQEEEHTHSSDCYSPLTAQEQAEVDSAAAKIAGLPALSEIEAAIAQYQADGDSQGLSQYSMATAAQIRAAYTAYEALNTTQQSYVTGYDALKTYDALLTTLDGYIIDSPQTIPATVSTSVEMPAGAQFLAQTVTSGDSYDQMEALAAAYLSQTASRLDSMYVMELHYTDAQGVMLAAETGSYQVCLTFEEPILPGTGQVYLFHMTGTGALEKLPAEVIETEEGITQISFETTGFSTYAAVRVAAGDTIIDEGDLPNKEGTGTIYWQLVEHDNGSRTLTFSGTGSTPDYTEKTLGDMPWYVYRNTATTIVFEEGITRIGNFTLKHFNIVDVDFGPTVAAIGTQAFGYARGFDTVTIPGTVKTVEANAFVYNNSLIHFILEEGVEVLGDNALGSQCGGTTVLTIPSTVTTIGNNFCWTASEFVVAEGNQHFKTVDGVLFTIDGQKLVQYPKRRVCESYTIPAGVTVQDSAMKYVSSNTQQIIISSGVKLEGSQYFRDSGVQSYIFAGDVALNNTGYMFTNCSSMKELVLPDTSFVISGSMFQGCEQLTELTIPETVTRLDTTAVNDNLHSLSTIHYNAANAEIRNNAIAAKAGEFALEIGTGVDRLQANFSQLVNKATGITFRGHNTIYVEPGVFDNAPAPLTGLSGWIHIADDNGTIYKLDETTKTATLYAVGPRVGTDFHIPATIIPTKADAEGIDGEVFTVTTIHANAFSRSGAVERVTLEDASVLENLGDYAFANTEIAAITDLTTNTTATSVSEANSLFAPGTFMGYSIYENTELQDAPVFSSDGFEDAMLGPGTLDIIAEGEATLLISAEGGTWTENAQGRGGYSLLTGQALTVTVSNTLTSVDKDVTYMVCLTRTDAAGSLGLTPGDYTLGSGESAVPVVCYPTANPNQIVLVFQGQTGKTLSFTLTPSYASPATAGGGLTITGQIVVDGTVYASDDTLYAYWGTRQQEYELEKKNGNGQATVSILTDSTGSRFNDSLKYIISTRNSAPIAEETGRDYVSYVSYTDRLTLPDGVSWDPAFLEAVANNSVSVARSGSNMALRVNGVDMITISRPNAPLYIGSIDVDLVDGEVELSWRIENRGDTDMGTFDTSVNITRPALVVEATGIGENRSITNTAKATIYYTHGAPAEPEPASVVKTIASSTGNLKLNKSGTEIYYFGEDVTYTLKLYNDGGLTWNSSQTGPHYLTDTLSRGSYIHSEKMMRMFNEAHGAGYPLTIRIERALVDLTQAGTYTTAVDGTSPVFITAANSNLEGAAEDTLTITFDGSQYTLTAASGTVITGTDLTQLLQRIAYGVQANDRYTCYWQLTQADKTLSITAGENRSFTIYSTAKDTFQRSGMDWPNEFTYDGAVPVINERAVVVAGNAPAGDKTTQLAQSGQVTSNTHRESTINLGLKYVHTDGMEYAFDYATDTIPFDNISEDGYLQYTHSFTHFGTGSLDDLPMVNQLSGDQYLLVPVAENPALAELGLEEKLINGVRYYILSQSGTYRNLRVGMEDNALLTAATVEVTEGSTLIKWYYDHLDGGNYVKTITFQTTLVFPETGSYGFNSMVWMNDRTDDRIYDTLRGGGVLIGFDKKILLSDGSYFESVTEENETVHYAITQGETLEYVLQLDSSGQGAQYPLAGSSIADELPNTYNTFQWEKGVNVQITEVNVVQGTVDNAEQLATDWTIGDSYQGISADGLQFIRWNDSLLLSFHDTAVVEIHVKLTFPGVQAGNAYTGDDPALQEQDAQQRTVWANYILQNQGAILQNSFMVDIYQATVTHLLKAPGEAWLQKGVYALVRQSGGAITAVGSSRSYYNIPSNNADRMVLYYVTVYNGGGNRLYLTEIYDKLPEGFVYVGLTQDLNLSGFHYTETHQLTTAGSSAFCVDAQDRVYKRVQIVDDETGADTGQIKFQFRSAGTDDECVKSDENGLYLSTGEAIVFGYLVQIPADADPQKVATNAAAMPYKDLVGAGVVLSEAGRTQTENVRDMYSDQNNGDCQIMSSAEMSGSHGYGFVAEGNPQWLSSKVTLEQGSIRPGTYKQIDSVQADKSSHPEPYNSSTTATAIINWSAELLNGGSQTITGYTIRDELPAPYVFTGPVTYQVYDGSGNTLLNSSHLSHTFFEVEGYIKNEAYTGEKLEITDPNQFQQAITGLKMKLTYRAGSSHFTESVDVLVADDPISCVTWDYQTEFLLDLKWSESGNLVLEIQPKGHYLDIPESGGKLVMTYSSVNPTTYAVSSTYINTLYLVPSTAQNFDPANIYSGKDYTITDSSGQTIEEGVMSTANLTISSGGYTDSWKTVSEVGNASNTASSRTPEKNFITVATRKTHFTYTLNVQNGSPTDESGKDMQWLVLVDNLPYDGDTWTYNADNLRNSQFIVRLAENPNWKVWITDKNGEITELTWQTDYIIEYSKKSDGFSDAERQGGDPNGEWLLLDQWLVEQGLGRRDVNSFRILIGSKFTGDENAVIIANGDTVHVSFEAMADFRSEEEEAGGEFDVQPGERAWNSFGYTYQYIGSGSTAEAMSAEVGVRVSARPQLTKELVDVSGNAYLAKEDMTFRFVIHQGQALPEQYTSQQELVEYLKEKGIPYLIQEMTVPKGTSQSEMVKLTPDGWRWTDGIDYTIVEFACDDPNFTFSSWSEEYVTTADSSHPYYTFTYSRERLIRIHCQNLYSLWSIQITKTDEPDENGGTLLLDGAVFGLYTDVRPDQTEGVRTLTAGDGSLWYLMAEATTESGVALFEGLAQERYYILEHKAPDGYLLDKTPIEVHRIEGVAVNQQSIINCTAAELPQTGGMGTVPFAMLGWLLMLAAGVGLIYMNKRRLGT